MNTRRALGRGARRLVRVAARGLDAVAPPGAGVVVLAYHQVGGVGERSINLPVRQFADQLALLREQGTVSTLDDALAGLASGSGTPHVVVTFDDGSPDVLEHAVPLLEQHRVPALLYLASGFVERGEPFWPGDRPLSWSALRDGCATGLLEVGSHTHDHLLLDRTPPADAKADLDRSCAVIEDELGRPVRHFAYPKALRASAANERIVRARFASAAVAGGRANVAGVADPWLLARTPVQTGDGPDDFVRKLSGGLRLEGRLRELADARYRGAAR